MTLDEAIAYALADEDVRATTAAPAGRRGASVPRGSSELTPREREVAVLVAQGLTSRRIADELVITEGTAALHVKRILGKLGFSPRAQIAAWVAQGGLGAP